MLSASEFWLKLNTMNIKCISFLLFFSIVFSSVACADEECFRVIIKKHDDAVTSAIIELKFKGANKINTGAIFQNNSINALGSLEGGFLTIHVKGSTYELGNYDVRTRIAIPMSDGLIIGSWTRNGVVFDAVVKQSKLDQDSDSEDPAGVDPFKLKK